MIFIGFGDENIDSSMTFIYFMQTTPEIWKRIYYKNQKTKYEVSNKGNIRNLFNKKILKQTKGKNKDKKITYEGKDNIYMYASINVNNKKYKVAVHRLVASAFIEIPDYLKAKGYTYDELVVNHKDGIKYHNGIYNLEWCADRYNRQHAYMTNLIKSNNLSVNYANKYINEGTARRVCELLEQGYSNSQISKIMGISENIPHDIKSGRTWKDISSEYSIDRIMESIPFKVKDEDVINIANEIMEGKISGEAIAKKYGVTKSYVTLVKNKEVRPDLLTKYDFSKRNNIPKRQDDNLLHNLCKDIVNGLSTNEIKEKYGVSISFISEIKHHKIRPDISSQYNFGSGKYLKQ